MKSYARAKYFEDAKPWNERCDIAFPCASQNEIDQPDALALINCGCRIIIEGMGDFDENILNLRKIPSISYDVT